MTRRDLHNRWWYRRPCRQSRLRPRRNRQSRQFLRRPRLLRWSLRCPLYLRPRLLPRRRLLRRWAPRRYPLRQYPLRRRPASRRNRPSHLRLRLRRRQLLRARQRCLRCWCRHSSRRTRRARRTRRRCAWTVVGGRDESSTLTPLAWCLAARRKTDGRGSSSGRMNATPSENTWRTPLVNRLY